MGSQKYLSLLRKSESGQSTVEYILLLAVVMALFFSIFRSRPFQEFLGEDSTFFNNIAKRLALDYRYSVRIPEDQNIDSSPTANHPSFVDDSGKSRFFGYEDGANYPPN